MTSCARAACNLGTFPRAPELAPPPECPPDVVCFTESDAKKIGLWLRDVDRWRLRVEGCLE